MIPNSIGLGRHRVREHVIKNGNVVLVDLVVDAPFEAEAVLGDAEQLILADVSFLRQHLAAFQTLRGLKQLFRGPNADFLHLDHKTRS